MPNGPMCIKGHLNDLGCQELLSLRVFCLPRILSLFNVWFAVEAFGLRRIPLMDRPSFRVLVMTIILLTLLVRIKFRRSFQNCQSDVSTSSRKLPSRTCSWPEPWPLQMDAPLRFSHGGVSSENRPVQPSCRANP